MLELINIKKAFNRGTINEKKALNGVNIKLDDGDFVTIIGGNGAGKSTTLNAIAGVWPVDEGSIIINGKNVTGLSEHQRAKYIGRVFQDPMTGTAATMEIQENLALAKRRGEGRFLKWGITRREREEYHEVGLLSGGQRQALTLLMATLKKPQILLLDEHTAALDPKTAAKVLQLSDEIIAKNHLTAMMVTHNMANSIEYGTRLIMMNDGKIIYDVKGEEKKKLTVDDLLQKFEEASGSALNNDRMLLSGNK